MSLFKINQVFVYAQAIFCMHVNAVSRLTWPFTRRRPYVFILAKGTRSG